jgi:hypothetical protein
MFRGDGKIRMAVCGSREASVSGSAGDSRTGGGLRGPDGARIDGWDAFGIAIVLSPRGPEAAKNPAFVDAASKTVLIPQRQTFTRGSRSAAAEAPRTHTPGLLRLQEGARSTDNGAGSRGEALSPPLPGAGERKGDSRGAGGGRDPVAAASRTSSVGAGAAASRLRHRNPLRRGRGECAARSSSVDSRSPQFAVKSGAVPCPAGARPCFFPIRVCAHPHASSFHP